MLSKIITKDEVVRKLIRQRCKYADQQAGRMQTIGFVNFAKVPKNLQADFLSRNIEMDLIYSMFPPRKKWCRIGEGRVSLDSTKRNEKRLYYTYVKAKRQNSTEEWYLKLSMYAENIVKMVLNPGQLLSKPEIFVVEKKCVEENIICRPVCSFPLNVKIALSLINRYLTSLFDTQFYSCSYAFRKPNKERGQFQHLNAVKTIQEYRKRHLKQSLFVAECDMQKFYDTIDHDIIKARFNILLGKVKREGRINTRDCRCIKKWFYNYVDCFSFYDDVYRLNFTDIDHPIWRTIKNRKNRKCCIEWIPCGKTNPGNFQKRKFRMGVPQGGALSGIIANIIMHFVDKVVIDVIGKKDILYIRFCDDMILIGPNKEDVKKVFDTYFNVVKHFKLYPHPPKDIQLKKMAEFWEGKTRGPYEWNEKGRDIFPWITFVGFDCNWEGNLRIRKSSLKKEIKKQFDVTKDMLKYYQNSANTPRYCSGTILNSLHSRLTGMAVGRIGLRDYKNNENIHSWMSAFSILDENSWSKDQLKSLDRHRCRMIFLAQKQFIKLNCPSYTKNTDGKRGGYIGVPYSYYGQCFYYKKTEDPLPSSTV